MFVAISQITFWLQKYNIDPKNESGLMLRAKLLNFAAWPIYFMAFIGVILGKRLTYKVTPKGDEQKSETAFSLFIPHLILGGITVIDVIVGAYLHHQAIQLVFWAITNTLFMWYFVASVLVEKVKNYVANIHPFTFFSAKQIEFEL